jgi:LysM repeat protein
MSKRSKLSVLVALVLAVLVIGSVVTPVSAASSERTVHVVQRDETLYSIARSYGVSVWAIARANNIANPNAIYAGQRLVIP